MLCSAPQEHSCVASIFYANMTISELFFILISVKFSFFAMTLLVSDLIPSISGKLAGSIFRANWTSYY
jgi:hypothetical protein